MVKSSMGRWVERSRVERADERRSFPAYSADALRALHDAPEIHEQRANNRRDGDGFEGGSKGIRERSEEEQGVVESRTAKLLERGVRAAPAELRELGAKYGKVKA